MTLLLVSKRRRFVRAVWAVVLGFLAPGAGQVFAGDWLLGVTINLGYVSCVALFFVAFAVLPLNRGTAIVYVLTMAAFMIAQLAIAVDAVRRIWRGTVGPPRPWYKRTWVAVPASLAVAMVIIPIELRRYETFHIPSGSDAPTVQIGDFILVDKGRSSLNDVGGKLVAFRIGPRNATWLKRVVGLPGDTVQIQAGQLYINGNRVPRDFIADESIAMPDGGSITAKLYHEMLPGGNVHDVLKYSDDSRFDVEQGIDANNTGLQTVPPGAVFVLGDNRDDSIDSRFPSIGFVPADSILGVARVVIWSRDHSRIMAAIK